MVGEARGIVHSGRLLQRAQNRLVQRRAPGRGKGFVAVPSAAAPRLLVPDDRATAAGAIRAFGGIFAEVRAAHPDSPLEGVLAEGKITGPQTEAGAEQHVRAVLGQGHEAGRRSHHGRPRGALGRARFGSGGVSVTGLGAERLHAGHRRPEQRPEDGS